MYAAITTEVVVASDSNLNDARTATAVVTQTKDKEVFDATITVGPADAEAQVVLGSIATAYRLAILPDYPIRVRMNGSSATQFIMTPNNVAATNQGAPLPPQSLSVNCWQVTSLYVQPIAGAAQTATVRIIATGDPATAY